MTEDEEKFYMIMNQNHLFRRVLDLTSTRDCHSLSRACKYLRRRTRFFKYRRNFDCRDHEITLDVQNLPGSNFWQASSGRGTIMSFCNFRRKCNFKITGDSYLFSIEDHKRIGVMMDEILDCLGNSKEVKIEVALTACFGEQLCDVISELRKDRITRISFCLDEITNITGFGRIPRNIFYGLRNVREIILEIYNELQVSFVDYITDCAVYMEGVEVLIYFDTSIGRRLYNSFRYMLEKGIFLSLHEKSYHSQDYTLQYLTSIKYKSLHFFVGLSVHINSGELLEDYLSIFSKMENLKYLTLYFKDGYNNYSRKVLWGNPISFVVKFHSMRNLRKLKTLSLYNFSSKISGSLLVSLLKCFPTQVRSLKLHGFDRIDQDVCLEINKALPLLTTLMFSEIKNVGVQCLKKLKKLKFFITTQSDIVYIPRKIKACMVIDKEHYGENEVNKKCCETYRRTLIETGVFTKEYFFGGLENCSIFFNRFGSVKNIIEAAFNLKDYGCTQY